MRCATAPPTWAWEVAGPPGAPAVLLVHGWMATAALNWYGSLDFLGRYFRTVAPNLRGHGRLGRGAPPFSVEGCADDLAELIKGLPLEKPIVIGYSMGGAVAQVLARRHRELIGGIVLCATAASFARHPDLRPLVRVISRIGAAGSRRYPDAAAGLLHWQIARHDRAAGTRGQSPAGDAAIGEAAIGDGAVGDGAVGDGAVGLRGAPGVPGAAALDGAVGLDGAAGLDGASGSPGQPDYMEWAMTERSKSDLATFIEAGAALNAYDSSGWLPELEVPAAVVITSRDQTVAPWRQETLAVLIPQARRYVVDAGHDVVVAAPDLLLPVLVNACRELAQR
ncbi:MAG TPA: alpha/beta fold hydrolase [Acidimicrobiales bacterium]|nr:alpha/beta fold hydrolase [Acidimicrobiales bacterium]